VDEMERRKTTSLAEKNSDKIDKAFNDVSELYDEAE